MSNMTLKAKCILSALTSMALTAIVATVVYFKVTSMVTTAGWVTHTYQAIENFKELQVLMIDMETGQRGFMMSGDENFLEPYTKAKGQFDEKLTKLQNKVSDNPTQVQRLTEALALKGKWLDFVDGQIKDRKEYDANKITADEFKKIAVNPGGKASMDGFRKLIADAVDMESTLNVKREAAAEAAGKSTLLWVIFGLGFAAVTGLVLIWLTISKAITSILKVTEVINSSVIEVSGSSENIASISEELSSMTTKQAASIEETSASTEELSSMVKQNSENAHQAAMLSKDSRKSAENGENEIRKLIVSVSDISKSSKEIEVVINLIDDIAFQTNLLALNAAVEAARAGEQGKGFAVVAEAVRGLAQKSAEAAKNISTLIGESVNRTDDGVKVADQCGQMLKDIVVSVSKVAELNGNISNASQQQSDGLNQINMAMNEIDKITQQNATTSAESAASAAELSAQAVALRGAVGQLMTTINGNGDTTSSRTRPAMVAERA